MGFQCGIIGLPNVGKSTLFNALTRTSLAQSANYPFCTIEPNIGEVDVPDERLNILSDINKSLQILPARLTFVDIAGLVKGASQGEGLGNQFLSNIREVDAVAHVVRCFDSTDIAHVHGQVNPVDDVEIINSELMLADLALCESVLASLEKKLKAQDKDVQKTVNCLGLIKDALEQSKPIRSLDLNDEQWDCLREFQFITHKSVVYVANVDEGAIKQGNNYVKDLNAYAASHGDDVVLISAAIEEECAVLEVDERRDYLAELGVTESGLQKLAGICFDLLGYQTYLTTGEKETRAWTIKKGMTAPQAAGVIHTDFEAGFIRANIVSYDDFVTCKGLKEAKEKGLLRQEGKEYVMQEGDVVEFLFNV